MNARSMLFCGLCVILIATGAARCSGAGGASREKQDHRPILVGTPWPWEARKSIHYGEGMQLALEEINGAGGVHGRPLRLLRLDDQEDVDRGRLLAQQLCDNHEVVAVIGHLQSYVTVPAAAAYDLSGLVLIAPTATSPDLTRRGYKRVFRTTFSDVDVGTAMADYALAQGYQRIVIYYSRDEYGRVLANAFEERITSGNGQVLNRHSYEPGGPANALPASDAAEAWQHIGADAVFIAGEGESAAMLAGELRRRGVNLPLLGGDALAIPAFLELGKGTIEGTVVPSRFSLDTPTPEVQHFIAAFRARYGADPDVGAALAYDALHILAHGMQQAADVTPVLIAQALHAERSWRGVTGELAFDSAGNLATVPVPKVVVRNGVFRHLDESVHAAARGHTP